LKIAVTLAAAVIVMVQAPVPVQLPLHPPNVKPLAGEALRVTCVPWAKLALQLPGQVIPLGLLVIVPAPDAGAVTVSVYVVAGGGGGVEDLELPPQLVRSRARPDKKIRRDEQRNSMAQ
jgi:hypothetical protein